MGDFNKNKCSHADATWVTEWQQYRCADCGAHWDQQFGVQGPPPIPSPWEPTGPTPEEPPEPQPVLSLTPVQEASSNELVEELARRTDYLFLVSTERCNKPLYYRKGMWVMTRSLVLKALARSDNYELRKEGEELG